MFTLKRIYWFKTIICTIIIAYPREIIPILDTVVNDEFNKILGPGGTGEGGDIPILQQRLCVRPYNLTGNLRPVR